MKHVGRTKRKQRLMKDIMFYYSGKNGKREHWVGFLIHKDTVNSVVGCRPVSSRIITIRMRASPFNITIIQAYAPTPDYDNADIEAFYEQLHKVPDETPKKDILVHVVQGDWNAKVGGDARKAWKGTRGPQCMRQPGVVLPVGGQSVIVFFSKLIITIQHICIISIRIL